ncbi:MAG: DUF1259 domain-containing protein [Deltaproteobacteria bacterium]|nr:DUF1259 domain-containing protein [Deltaproteobacteria bacterium]
MSKTRALKEICKICILWAFFLIFPAGWQPVRAAVDFPAVEKILGAKGQMQEGALVVRFPRTDLKVSIAGEPVPTGLGFTSWTAWVKMGDKAMVMGDLVLLEREVNPVISTLGTAGIQVTALHNHFLSEQPRIMFMHIDGKGSPETLAEGIRKALSQTATPMPPAPASPSPALPLDTRKIEQIIGHPGQLGGGVFKITVGRAGITMSGMELTSSMGVNSWAAFMGNDDRAHVAGDIVMTAREVPRVIQALRQGGVDIVAVHNHMLTEEPRIFFLHYWGTGTAAHLAKTVRAAFDQARGPMR